MRLHPQHGLLLKPCLVGGDELPDILLAGRVGGVEVSVEGVIDRSNPVRKDVSVFNWVRLRFALSGVDEDQAEMLVEGFKGR